ncbi:hypothetical protein GALMADRAFT_259284 [Galerina marginata CBS 339.88]|uniref:Secreted protein n=1 Tax=Galerina marginata (strain CBS 339.88) TaxID=685588 RepID=A0A067S981_GALM3|nr:hypothetical protein GALMADRAFT_259284 [Galerina marginata CBS 339.88]
MLHTRYLCLCILGSLSLYPSSIFNTSLSPLALLADTASIHVLFVVRSVPLPGSSMRQSSFGGFRDPLPAYILFEGRGARRLETFMVV